jgi:hypothetical protein
VDAEHCVTSCDLSVFVGQAAEPVPPQNPDTCLYCGRILAPGGRISGAASGAADAYCSDRRTRRGRAPIRANLRMAPPNLRRLPSGPSLARTLAPASPPGHLFKQIAAPARKRETETPSGMCCRSAPLPARQMGRIRTWSRTRAGRTATRHPPGARAGGPSRSPPNATIKPTRLMASSPLDLRGPCQPVDQQPHVEKRWRPCTDGEEVSPPAAGDDHETPRAKAANGTPPGRDAA